MDAALKAKALDVAERTGATFAEAMLGGLLLAPSLDLSSIHAAILAGVISAVAYTKSTLALFIGKNTVSPASLVPSPTKGVLPPSNPAHAGLMPQKAEYGSMEVGGVMITVLPYHRPEGSS